MGKIPIDIPRLCVAVQKSRLATRVQRLNRTEMVREYTGQHYAENGAEKKVPVNLLALYVQVVGKALIAKNPRVMLSTHDKSIKATLDAVQTWMNKEIEKMDLATTLHRVVVDAMFGIGIAKVALAKPTEAANVGWGLGAGQPTVSHIDPDDWVYDIHARDFSSCSFMGHRYRVPLEAARSMYKKYAKDLAASMDLKYNEAGDERISMIGRGNLANDDEFEDMVDLWEIYLPRHRTVVTLMDDGTGPAVFSDDKPLMEQPWVGPYCGPYHILKYGVVPGNPMPKAPIQDLYDLSLAMNRGVRKLISMSERQKEIGLVQAGATEDGARVVQANDGDVISCNNPQSFKQAVFGGSALQQVQGVVTWIDMMFNKLGGNLQLLGGQGPQSPTATQDKMLNENAGSGIADKQDTTVQFTSHVLKAFAWFAWKDPHLVQRSVKKVGTAEITREVYPARSQDPQALLKRTAPFEDLDISVDPYSLQHQTPQMRLANIRSLVTQIIMPMQPMLQQSGITFDINAYMKLEAAYGDLPELADILTIQEPPQEAAGGGESEEMGMPASTTRNYVRESRSQRTDEGTSKDMIQRMMGQNPGGQHNNGAA